MSNKQLSTKELEALKAIRNSIANFGRMPSVRDLMRALGYESPRSASLIINKLIEKEILSKSEGTLRLISDYYSNDRASTVDVPLVGQIACGTPILAEENIEALIPVSTGLAKPPYKYFILRAVGDSMDEKGINDGDMVLIRQQQTANDGDGVVALIDDSATIKEMRSSDEAVVLYPRSSNNSHQPIVLTHDFMIQGVVIATLPGQGSSEGVNL